MPRTGGTPRGGEGSPRLWGAPSPRRAGARGATLEESLDGSASAALASLTPSPAARADAVSAGAPMKEYRDEQDKYAFSVPSDWVQAEGVTA